MVGTPGPDEGAVFTGTADGSIFRVSHDGRRIDRVAHTGGRPLGIEIDLDGRLLVCDAHRGVLRVDTATGAVEQVTDSSPADAWSSATTPPSRADGTVWFSDSSTKFGIEHWKDDFVQDTRTGRLLRLGTDGRIDVVLDGLAFANGVALGGRRVVRRRRRVRRAHRRTALDHRRPGRAARPARRRTCPATPTTSPGAATG